jgi:hypothetical protein
MLGRSRFVSNGIMSASLEFFVGEGRQGGGGQDVVVFRVHWGMSH